MIRKQKQVKQWISRSQISHKYQILPRKYDQEWWLACLTHFAYINFDIINCQFVHQNKCAYSNSIKMYDGKRSVGIWTNKQKMLVQLVVKSSDWGHQYLYGWSRFALRFSYQGYINIYR